MLKSCTFALAAAALASAGFAPLARAEFAIHRSDDSSRPVDYAGLFDIDTGIQSAPLAYSNSYYLQSLDYDATSGALFGLVREPYQARLLSWDSDGSVLSDVSLSNYPPDYPAYGMDVSVHNGTAVVHRRDSYGLTSDVPYIYNASTGYRIASLSVYGTNTSAYNYALQSLDFDAESGNVFGLARDYSGTARLLNWSPSGSLLSDIALNGYPTDGSNYGLDISAHDGIVAVHRRDSIGLLADYARLYDTATGLLIAALSYSSTANNPVYYYLQSLDFDATTGNLFGLVIDSAHGSQARLLSWDRTGALLADIAVAGYPSIGTNAGADLAVLTTVPEPSTFALAAVFGVVGVSGVASRGRRRGRQAVRRSTRGVTLAA